MKVFECETKESFRMRNENVLMATKKTVFHSFVSENALCRNKRNVFDFYDSFRLSTVFLFRIKQGFPTHGISTISEK